jgi:hypothetical protein
MIVDATRYLHSQSIRAHMIKHPCGEQGTSLAGHKIKILRYSAYEKNHLL